MPHVLRRFRDQGMLPHNDEEGCLFGAAMHAVVVCKFGRLQQLDPVVLVLGSKHSQVVFQGLILALGLTVSLRMESCA